MSSDYFGSRYFPGAYFTTAYFGLGETDPNRLAGIAMGVATVSGTLTGVRVAAEPNGVFLGKRSKTRRIRRDEDEILIMMMAA